MPAGIVTWSDVYALAARLDEVAQSLGVPGWLPLTSDADWVFSLPDVYRQDLAYHFDTAQSTISITDHFAAAALASDDGLTLPKCLQNLAGIGPVDNSLFFGGPLYYVMEADDCLCRTIFKVKGSDGHYQFEAADKTGLGCCQTLEIPESLLDYTQHIIPAAWAAHFADGEPHPPSDDPWFQPEPKCKKNSSGIMFKMTHSRGPNIFQMIAASRFMNGYFTWPISIALMDRFIDKLNALLGTLGNTGGLIARDFRDGQGGQFAVGGTCRLSLDLLVNTMAQRAQLTDGPGCILNFFPDVGFGSEYHFCAPWKEQCCSSGKCGDGDKFLVYKKTIDDLKLVLDNISLYGRYEAEPSCCPLFIKSGFWEPGPHDETIPLPDPAAVCPGFSDDSVGWRVQWVLQGFADILDMDGYSQNALFCPDPAPCQFAGILKGSGEDSHLAATVYPGFPGHLIWNLYATLEMSESP